MGEMYIFAKFCKHAERDQNDSLKSIVERIEGRLTEYFRTKIDPIDAVIIEPFATRIKQGEENADILVQTLGILPNDYRSECFEKDLEKAAAIIADYCGRMFSCDRCKEERAVRCRVYALDGIVRNVFKPGGVRMTVA